MKKQRQELSLHDLVSVFLPKLWIVAIVAILFALITMVYSVAFKQDTYTCSVEMYVYKNSQPVSGADISVAQQMLPNYKRVLFSDEFLDECVCKPLNAENETNKYSPSKVRGMMSFSTPAETKYFQISVTSTDPELSFKIAYLIENSAWSYISGAIPDAFTLRTGDHAEPTETPNSKNIAGNALIAFFIGAVLTLAVIWIVYIFDFIIRDKKKLEANFDLPVLAVIPRQVVPTSPQNVGGGNKHEV